MHYGDIESEGFKTLSEGEEVTFEVIDSPKGPKATHVVKVTTVNPRPKYTGPAKTWDCNAEQCFEKKPPPVNRGGKD